MLPGKKHKKTPRYLGRIKIRGTTQVVQTHRSKCRKLRTQSVNAGIRRHSSWRCACKTQQERPAQTV